MKDYALEATPILTGKDAERLRKEIRETNRKMRNPKYRRKVEKRLARCIKIYEQFRPRGKKEK